MSTIDAAIINHITNNSVANNAIPTEDVLTRNEGEQSGRNTEDGRYIITIEESSRAKQPGNILRLRTKNGEIISFIVICYKDITDTFVDFSYENRNARIVDINTDGVIDGVLYCDSNITLVFNPLSFGFEDFDNTDIEVGFFINEQMSYKTLQKTLRCSMFFPFTISV